MRITQACALKLRLDKSTPKKLPPLPTVAELVQLYQVQAAKFLSQNFLYDPKIIRKLVNVIRPGSLKGYNICEIGPGPGSITRELIKRNPEQLMVVEKDFRFLPMLQYVSKISDQKLKIVHGDILKFDLQQAFPKDQGRAWNEDCPDFNICGNLPFNISLPLIFKLLTDISLKQNAFQHGRIPMVFTFQHEVGERLIAKPGCDQRCRLSVTAQAYCDTSYPFSILGGSFHPPPKVDVAVVKMVPKKKFLFDEITTDPVPFKQFDRVVKHTMHNRKKPCGHGVSTLFPPRRRDLTNRMFRLASVDKETPGANLENNHFRDLYFAYEEIASRIPQLRDVDGYGDSVWLKKFDDTGEPLPDEKVVREPSDTQADDLSQAIKNLKDVQVGKENEIIRKSRHMRTNQSKGVSVEEIFR